MEHFDEGTLENLEQVKRIVAGLKKHPDILEKHLPAEDRGKPIVACVLNALPYSIPGGTDGVYFHDFSVLGCFFKSGQVMAHTFSGAEGRISSVPFLRIWSGDGPTAEDLLAQMEKTVQFTAVEDTLEFIIQAFRLSEDCHVVARDFRRGEHPAMAQLADGAAR
jgi:hypothetical protein